jgi:hypothetical protein
VGFVIRRSRHSILDPQEWPNLESGVAYFCQHKFRTLCRQPDGNLSRERPLLLLPWDGIGRSVMIIFERICVASALTGFLVLVGATVALFVVT